jgi:hypothetical protein
MKGGIDRIGRRGGIATRDRQRKQLLDVGWLWLIYLN